jgi:hypothetical protein
MGHNTYDFELEHVRRNNLKKFRFLNYFGIYKDFEKNSNRLWLNFQPSTKLGFAFFKFQNFYLEYWKNQKYYQNLS